MFRAFFVLIFAFFPLHTFGAGVIINEIAWMGMTPKDGESAQAAANNEWIELYNSGSAAVSLEGWKIVAEDGAPDITLEGSIPAGGYFLLERGSDDVIPEISADLVYPFKNNALENSGERLLLKDSSGTVIDEVNATGGWPAGDNSTKETMQRSGSDWITALATPKAENTGFSSTEPQSGGGASGNTSSVSSVSAPESEETIRAYAGEDKTVAVGSEINFLGSATGLNGKPLENARFWWNFGDGASKEGRSVGHVFMIPGEYTVGLHVSTGEYAASDYLKVSVIPNQIEVSGVVIGEKGYLKIKNPSAVEIEIGGWIMEDAAGQRFIIPPKTKIGAGAEIALANSTTGLFLSGAARLTIYYSNLIKAREWNCSTSDVAQFCSTAGVEHETVIPGQVRASGTKQAYGSAASPSASAGASADKSAPRNEGGGDSLSAAQDDKTENKPASSETNASAFAQLSESPRAPQLIFVTAFVLSLLAAAGFLVSKKFIA